MKHEAAERRIKALQKELLVWIEEQGDLAGLDHETFHAIRKRVFRSTFDAYRLGYVGLDEAGDLPLWQQFFGWLENHSAVVGLPPVARAKVAEKTFLTTLQAFRLGAMVAVNKRENNDDAVFDREYAGKPHQATC
jgi:hypothetical protein